MKQRIQERVAKMKQFKTANSTFTKLLAIVFSALVAELSALWKKVPLLIFLYILGKSLEISHSKDHATAVRLMEDFNDGVVIVMLVLTGVCGVLALIVYLIDKYL